MVFTPAEITGCNRLIELALAEDLGAAGNVTSQAIIPPDLAGHAVYIAGAPGVIAGLGVMPLVAAAAGTKLKFTLLVEDGTSIKAGARLAVLSGPVRDVLLVERTTLNFLQRLSGVATLTRRFVDAVAGLPCQILDTRKTSPGMRLLEKYAVRCGGGHNHRLGLYDGILIKDNHLAALQIIERKLPIEGVVRRAREQVNHATMELEVDFLEQLDVALACRPDIVLLDNMTTEQFREAVQRRNAVAPGVLLEASGGITLGNVRTIAETGVDRISVGALTHSAPALDIELDYIKE